MSYKLLQVSQLNKCRFLFIDVFRKCLPVCIYISIFRGPNPGAAATGAAGTPGPPACPPGGPPPRFPGGPPPGHMAPNGPHDLPPMGPPNMTQGPPGMMQNFGPGEGPPNQAMMPPGGGSARNFYDTFYQQQQNVGSEGEGGEGELFFFSFPVGNQNNMNKRPNTAQNV